MPLAPLVSQIDPGTIGAAIPALDLPKPKNYADNGEVRGQFNRDVLPVVRQARYNRAEQEAEWLNILRMWQMKRDTGVGYNGPTKAYLPVWARIQEAKVSALSRGLFPSDDYMGVSETTETNPDATKATERYIRYEWEQNAHVRSRIKQLLGQLENYGTSPMKVWYEKPSAKPRKRGGLKRLQDVLRNAAMGSQTAAAWTPTWEGEGLRVSPRPLFYWYVYPTTAQSLDEATVVFEDIDVPRITAEAMIRSGEWIDEEAVRAALPSTVDGHLNNQYELKDKLAGDDSNSHPSEQGTVLCITEGYTMMSLPSDAYVGDEDRGAPVPVKFVLANQALVSLVRNPFWHQRPPYVVGRMNWQPGMFYGRGTGKLVYWLQMLANDFANQTADVGQYVLNPMLLINPGLMAGPHNKVRPGVSWYVTDVAAAMKFDRPPVELLQHGLTMLQFLVSMAMDLGGAPPIMQGIGGGKAGRTATQSQILQGNVSNATQDIVEDLELDCMIPMMWMTWLLGQQYVDSERELLIAGESFKVSREVLAVNNPVFRYMASSQSVNRAQRAQQALSLLQAVAPVMPYLNSLGYIVDPAALIKRVYMDGFGFRGFEQFIRQAVQPVPGMQPGVQATPQAASAASTEQNDRVRSTLEQLQGVMGNEAGMVPGEGEGFMEMRQGADQMAGMMGDMGGNNGK